MSESRYKEFFITAHLGAVCYEDIENIVGEINTDLYAVITHDRDLVLKDDGTWEATPTHKHVVLLLKNGTTLKSITNKFEGAHVELIKYKNKAIKYLIHSTDNAREKYQYDLEDILTNNLERVKAVINLVEKEHFDEDQYKQYIADGTTTKYRFIERFGLGAYKQWWRPFSDAIIESYNDGEMKEEIERLITEKEGLPF